MPDPGHVPVLEQEHLPKPARQTIRAFHNLVAVLEHGVVTDLVTTPQLRLLRLEFTGRAEVGFQERLVATQVG
jgi:hypothetical protein